MHKPLVAVALLACALVLASCSGTRSAARTPGTRYAPFETGRILYDDRGPDEPTALVLVHGWACDMTIWSHNVGAFSDHLRTIAVDLPGHGGSRGPARGYSVELIARAVDAVVEHAGVEHPILVGHSSGASVVRAYDRLYPGKVAGLIVVEGSLQPTITPEAVESFVVDMQRKDSRRAITEHVEGLLRDDTDPEVRALILDSVLSTPRTIMIDTLRLSADPSSFSDQPIDVPLLSVVSDADPRWSRSYENYVRLLAPEVEYRKLRNVGHFLMLDDPQRFVEIVLEFLDEHSLLPPPAPLDR